MVACLSITNHYRVGVVCRICFISQNQSCGVGGLRQRIVYDAGKFDSDIIVGRCGNKKCLV